MTSSPADGNIPFAIPNSLSNEESSMSLDPPPFAQAMADVAAADIAATPQPEGMRNLDTIMRIPVEVQVVLGSATMPVANLIKLGRGAVIPLDHRVGEPVDVVVNGRIVARGEVVVVEDDNSRFGVSLTEIVGPSSSDQNG
jgi:flagellar motor switch protein FliN/FliY